MSQPAQAEPEVAEEITARQLWQDSVGKVFKIAAKIYGMSKVTYTQVKVVRETDIDGRFEIEVLCVEITARVLSGKRTHSNICKEGVLPQEAGTELRPECFGEECSLAEFEKVTGAMLAYTNSYLDWVMQAAPEERTEIEAPIDAPHLQLTDMEASLVRHSPFLVPDRKLYFLTPGSIRVALTSIQQEMLRGSRNMLLVDAVDPVYVTRKNDAAATLHAKLKQAQLDAAAAWRSAASAGLQHDSMALALLGKPSATSLHWVAANPSEEGAVCRLGPHCVPLDFMRWAHVSGRQVPAESIGTREVRTYFGGFDGHYTGPDAEGIYPLLRPATE